jgi:hypothetical protein
MIAMKLQPTLKVEILILNSIVAVKLQQPNDGKNNETTPEQPKCDCKI